eukprot:CAMPEP_0172444694 /NCGR_PEP_ID=MMETSP1065-20121228/4707_1 /TAXON_ID=265537 /ORGANISM="Amphiprora paludosa, Strain CCMP125" /LENGTH=557 /DNA_ID=CAMNT_0013195329 /DNA_START=6 /DNA_END=1676 /DNA_ORIENTATION=-
MEDLFNMLSSSARFDKKKTKKDRKAGSDATIRAPLSQQLNPDADDEGETEMRSRDRTGKRDTSEEKLKQIHKEQVAAFRRTMCIKLANKHDPNVPDPISTFSDVSRPKWWNSRKKAQNSDKSDEEVFQNISRAILRNIEAGRWKEPTSIQMQAIPTLMQRRDFIGAAPTGSGKSGAFIVPSLFLCSAPHSIFYNSNTKIKNRGQGEIRALLIAPSLELAVQLHREVERLGLGKMGGLSAMLLSKSNAPNVISGSAGGKHGLDVLVSTPLRLVDSIEKGLKLNSVRIVVLDEADRLLDAADGKRKSKDKREKNKEPENSDSGSSDDESESEDGKAKSGSTQTKTFLAQMDVILSEVPSSAVRGLFSATVTPTVRSLSESILRDPVDVSIAKSGSSAGANPDIDQKLTFVSNEQGKLLAIRQLVQEGKLHPPVIVFLQSQERAQALFEELLYDNMHVDVIHAGRSRAARENAVTKFRKGETWVLICTDLVARGVDFRAVNMVINYDLPTSGITYVHRIGRTGRAGRKGTAITLFTEGDFEHLRTIANIMRQSGCQVDDW